MYGLARGTESMMQWSAGRSTLSGDTLQRISSKYGIETAKLGTSISSVKDALAAEQSGLRALVSAPASAEMSATRSLLAKSGIDPNVLESVALARGAGLRASSEELKIVLRSKGALEPELAALESALLQSEAQLPQRLRLADLDVGLSGGTNWRYIFQPRSGETVAQNWLNGVGKLEVARDSIRSHLGYGAGGFTFGAGRKLLYGGTGEAAADGSSYDLGSIDGLKRLGYDAAVEGGSNALVTMFSAPFAGHMLGWGTRATNRLGGGLVGTGSGMRSG